jgi:hypothetical protein
MKKDLNSKRRPSGSKKKNEPKVFGKVLIEYFQSEEPLADAFRDRMFKDIFPQTELGIDLKLMTRQPRRINEGEYLAGMLTRDGLDHFSFVENYPEKKREVVVRRNPHIYRGRCINVSQQDDGSLYPSFNRPPYTEDFTFQDFCKESAEELLTIAGLLRE